MKKDDIGQAFEPSVMCYRELDSITSQLEERMQVDNIRGRSTLMLCLSDNNETVLNFLDVLLESTDKSRADLLNSISVLDGNSADILSDIVRLKIITTYAKVMLDSSKFKGIYQEHNGNMDDSLRAMVEQGSDILLGKIIMLINEENFLQKHDENLIKTVLPDYNNPFITFTDILEKAAQDMNYSANVLDSTNIFQDFGLFKSQNSDGKSNKGEHNLDNNDPYSAKPTKK